MGGLAGDYGSAYDIGLRGLRAAFISTWPHTAHLPMCSHAAALGVEDLRGIFHRAYVGAPSTA